MYNSIRSAMTVTSWAANWQETWTGYKYIQKGKYCVGWREAMERRRGDRGNREEEKRCNGRPENPTNDIEHLRPHWDVCLPQKLTLYEQRRILLTRRTFFTWITGLISFCSDTFTYPQYRTTCNTGTWGLKDLWFWCDVLHADGCSHYCDHQRLNP